MIKMLHNSKYEISVKSGGKYKGVYLKRRNMGNNPTEYIFKKTYRWNKKMEKWVEEGVGTHTILKKRISNIRLIYIQKEKSKQAHAELINIRNTGLHDITGKELCLGDRVRFGVWCDPVGGTYEMQEGKIIYEYGAFWIEFILKWTEKKERRLLSHFYWDKESHYVPNKGDVWDRNDTPINELKII